MAEILLFLLNKNILYDIFESICHLIVFRTQKWFRSSEVVKILVPEDKGSLKETIYLWKIYFAFDLDGTLT